MCYKNMGNIVFMYSGQGSQYYQMGRILFDENSMFNNCMRELDSIAYKFGGYSIIERLFDKTRKISEAFDDIRYSHPAIYMVECSLTKMMNNEGIFPDYVFGTSLGEICAMVASGVLTMEDGMTIVMRQATDLYEKVPQDYGIMTILKESDFYYQNELLHNYTELIAQNYEQHFVVSGHSDELFLLEQILKRDGNRCQILPIHYAFHSRYIEKEKNLIANSYDGIKLKKPKCTYISGINGNVMELLPPDYIWNVMRNRMNVPNGIEYLECSGPKIYIDLGVGGTMGSFARRNLKRESDSVINSIVTPLGNEYNNFNRTINSFK
jgi:trans-AT polyketide synthase/acyltransferase/oxidoreductase domain-containing protein